MGNAITYRSQVVVLFIHFVSVWGCKEAKKGSLQPCQNVPGASNFAAFSPVFATCSTLDFTMSPLAGKGTWCLLTTTPSILPAATKHFDRAESLAVILSEALWASSLTFFGSVVLPLN